MKENVSSIEDSGNADGSPPDLRTARPNAESLAAMAEAERISRDSAVKGYRDMNVLFKDLDSENS